MAEEDTLTLKATEIEAFLEIGDPINDLETMFEKVLEIFKSEGGKNFIVGKVIIENDLADEEEDDEDEESEESDDKTTTETKE